MTPTTEQLESLLERVKAATGPDRELDFHIQKAFGLASRERIENSDFGFFGDYQRGQVLPVTTSIDAALALVERVFPKGSVTMEDSRNDSFAPVAAVSPDYRTPHSAGEGATLPLSILAALLTTLIAQAKERGE